MPPRLSVSQITTFRSGFAEDVRNYAAAGLDALGIWELKLAGGDAQALEALAASGLRVGSAVPELPSVLPLPLLGGPEDPAERLDAYCRSLERLAAFEPASVVLLTGSGEGRTADGARRIAVEALRTIGAEAARLGLRVGLEPYQRDGGDAWTIVSTIPEAVALLRDAGDPPAVGIQFDVWHLWNTPTLFEDVAQHAGRLAGVHVCDVRSPTRGWADRVLPGDGIARVPAILQALDAAGWDGLYELEIFSDDGTFGAAYPDSLWAEAPSEMLTRALGAFERCWSVSPSAAASGGSQ